MLLDFLNAKPLYYDEIDYTRMPRIYEKIKHHMPKPKTIHLIGTNGKGTTGRFLATSLHNLGYKVGHYTSPHIMEFNERIWLEGKDSSDELLEKNHQKLRSILSSEDADALSYFEYTTLLAMLCFSECDYVVLEAGLGGEHDATAVFPKTLTLVTPIDKDHEVFLGDTVEAIATTKMNAVQNNAILAKQKHENVYDVAKKLNERKKINISPLEQHLEADDHDKIKQIAKELMLEDYLVQNLSLAVGGLKSLGVEYEVESFKNARLFGRLSPVGENILVDVGHNPLAAKSIAKALEGERVNLIYNSYKDKNYKEILQTLKPIVDLVEIIDVYDVRAESRALLQNTLKELEIKYIDFTQIDPKQKYLVFGSFSVVEAFLRKYNG